MKRSRLPLLLALLGVLTIGIFLRPSPAVAPAAPSSSANSTPAFSIVPPLSEGAIGIRERLVKQARDCLYTLGMAKAQNYIQELGRTARSGEQLEVETIEELDRVRIYADRIGSGLASPLSEGRWVVLADGMPVILVDESSGTVTTYEGQPLCP